MRIRWFGQSAFLLSGERSVFVDPFGDVSRLVSQGLQFDYPPIEGVSADLVLVTHEHGDHNAAEVIGGSPVVLRSTAGRLESPLGEVVAIASEHDAAGGTARGPNTIFCFRSTASASPTSATSGRRHCGRSSARRSARST